MKTKRIAILSRIDKLDKQRCDECSNKKYHNQTVHACNCKASTEIRTLGNQLERLVNKRASERLLESLTFETFTKYDYMRLRELEVMDIEIRKHFQITNPTFYDWKSARGIVKCREKWGDKKCKI